MATIDNDGVKIGARYWPFTEGEICEGCRFVKHIDEAEGVVVDRDICKMSFDDEDKFLFGGVPEEKVPPCMKE